ncbi:ty3-gypsy retrotransposon protein [Tanacetum coccineum]
MTRSLFHILNSYLVSLSFSANFQPFNITTTKRPSGKETIRRDGSFPSQSTFCYLTPDKRLRIVNFNLEGAAAEWFQWMTRNDLITTWTRFEESVKNRFEPSKYEDPKGALSKLLQLGTVEDYQVFGFLTRGQGLVCTFKGKGQK